MANTYTQTYVMLVFAVGQRLNCIKENKEIKIYKYISGILKTQTQKVICINGASDHIHILVSIKPDKSISDLVRDVKSNSSKWINENKLFTGKFHWQTGYGAFSYSHSQLPDVIKYIENQKEHHKVISFNEEYIKLLKHFGIEYDEKYIFV